MEPNWQLARKRTVLEQRARIIQQIRAFFIERDFLEVETPQRIPANAPEAHIDAVAADGWFLQTSPELCMKRLLAAGYPQLFQICRCWRAGEQGRYHLPEYSMLEWYRTDCDYRQLMADCHDLLLTLCPSGTVRYQGREIDLTPPWPELTVDEAFCRYAEQSLEQALAADDFERTLTEEIEPAFPVGRPLLLTEYPVEEAALARKKPSDPGVVERFELYIGGLELVNAFSELNDPDEQKQRFQAEESRRRQAGKPPYPDAEAFLRELATMPQAAGIALGIDRLIMLLLDASDIAAVTSFTPQEL